MNYIKHRIKTNTQLMLLLFIVMGIISYIFLRFYVGNDFYLFFSSILIGISVITILGYQYDKKSTDYYYSLPISKTKLFMYNQIAGYIILMLPILFWYSLTSILNQQTFDFINHLSFLASLTYTYLIFSLITTLSHNDIDTVILMIIYYVIPFIGITYTIEFLQNTLLGFPLSEQHSHFFIRMTTFYVVSDSNMNLLNLVLYVIWYIICVGVVLKITYYFVSQRKVEYSGGNFPHPRVYTVIKGLVIFIYLIASNRYANISDFGVFKSVFFNNALIGLIIFIVFTAIHKRSIQVVFSSVLKYLMVVALFVVSIFTFSYLKSEFYEQKMPKNVVSAQVILDKKGISIYHRNTNENLVHFKEKENLNIIKNIHKSRIEMKRPYFPGPSSAITLSYQTDQFYPFVRKYYLLGESDSFNRMIQSLYTSDEFEKTLDSLLSSVEKVRIFRRSELEAYFEKDMNKNEFKMALMGRLSEGVIGFKKYHDYIEHDGYDDYYVDIGEYRIQFYFEIE